VDDGRTGSRGFPADAKLRAWLAALARALQLA
jgi:hypothetical protein